MTITNGEELVDSAYYAAHGAPHHIWTRLRAESPVHRCQPEGYQPFWAITKYDDITTISTQPNRFTNSRGITLLKTADEAALNSSGLASMRSIITMDPPEHHDIRAIATPSFTPRGISMLDDEIERSAREVVDMMAGETGEGECDFATDVATAHPLRILSNMLGVPRSQELDILRITNELFAFEDPELQRETDRTKALMELAMEAYSMFDTIIQDRRTCPRDDLASLLANGCLHGEQLGMMETMGYYLIVFSAGHDTTKNALVGGMQAFIEHPDEIAKVKRDPELIDRAVEEIVRWTTPVNYMKRTAAEDTEIRGRAIAAGDALVLFYASANRDEDVFDDPFTFQVDREVRRNLGFGFGEHFCLGASLARRSQRAFWLELLPRLESIELAGAPQQIQSSFVVGQRHLPVRYRIRPAAGDGSSR
jgi:cytochrome P450